MRDRIGDYLLLPFGECIDCFGVKMVQLLRGSAPGTAAGAGGVADEQLAIDNWQLAISNIQVGDE